jgi:drug/metabolite transporter (DMT)-like permease
MISNNKEVFLIGLFGATASLCGKLSLSQGTLAAPLHICNSLGGYCVVISLTFRVIFFVLMLGCNALMMSNFLVALEKKGSLMVVIVSSSINMILTGIFGLCLLGEIVKDNWFAGAFLMSIGVTLIAISQDTKNEKVGIKAEES